MSNQIFPAAVRGLGFTVTKAPQDAVIVQSSSSFVQTRIVQNQNPIWKWSLLYDFLIDNPLKPNPSYTYTDLQQMLGFVTSMRNSGNDFLFLDPDDNSIGPAVITQGWLPKYPFAFGAIIVVAGNAWQVGSAPAGSRSAISQPSFASSPQVDGGLTWYQLGAVTGTGWPNPQAQLQLVTDGTNYYCPIQVNRGGQFWEDITDLAGGITVYGNGSLIGSTAYNIQFGGLSFSGFSSAGMYLNFGTSPPATPVTATFNYYYRVHFADDSQDFEKWANQWWAIGGEAGSRGKGELKLETARSSNAVPSPPFPPFAFPGGATNVLIIYPGAVALVNGSVIGVPQTNLTYGQANGNAGPNAWFSVILNNVIAGTRGGQATFTGYTDPGIPRAAIKGVYSYIPFTHFGGVSGMVGGYWNAVTANGNPAVGNPNAFSLGSWANGMPVGGNVMASLLGGPVTAANLNYSTITQQIYMAHSLYGYYHDQAVGNPMVIIYY